MDNLRGILVSDQHGFNNENLLCSLRLDGLGPVAGAKIRDYAIHYIGSSGESPVDPDGISNYDVSPVFLVTHHRLGTVQI